MSCPITSILGSLESLDNNLMISVQETQKKGEERQKRRKKIKGIQLFFFFFFFFFFKFFEMYSVVLSARGNFAGTSDWKNLVQFQKI